MNELEKLEKLQREGMERMIEIDKRTMELIDGRTKEVEVLLSPIKDEDMQKVYQNKNAGIEWLIYK